VITRMRLVFGAGEPGSLWRSVAAAVSTVIVTLPLSSVWSELAPQTCCQRCWIGAAALNKRAGRIGKRHMGRTGQGAHSAGMIALSSHSALPARAMPLALVTGGCGFIGSHLVAALLARGDRVRVLDDLSTGRRENLAPGAELSEGDVADPAAVRAAMAGAAVCFHLAAIASVERGMTEWLTTHRANLSGTIAVFDAARAAGRIPVVYASSAAVYGEQERLPIAEDAPTLPLSAYGADKLGCELHARVAGHVHGVPTMGLRFFNVFGARQDPGSPYSGVISIFCDRMSRGEGVTIHGDGGQTRDFIHVSDVVRGLVAAAGAANVSAPVVNPVSYTHLTLPTTERV